MDLEQRVERLERENRRLKVVGVAQCCTGVELQQFLCY